LNLYGKKVYGDDTATKKMIVLTYKTSESALSVIKKGYVLNTLTSKVIDKINEAYKETETSGEKEQYFVVGKNGTISMLVHGNQEEITGAEKSLAHLDILDAGDSIDFAVHSHGFRFKDNGNVDISGNYVPSEKDVNSASLLIEIVLGFKKISTVSDTNTSIVSQIRREDYEKFIGFYNQDCEKEQTFLSMSLKKFTGIVNDIEKYQPKPQKK
jgi:hypothetical protein